MKKQMKGDGGCINTKSRIERLPSCLLVNDILLKLDLDSLCTLSCVSTVFRSSASQALALLPSLDLSGFSPDFATLKSILTKCSRIKTLTVNCLRVDNDNCISCFLCPSIEELNLLCCYSFYPEDLSDIPKKCPNLRALMLELNTCDTHCLNRVLINCGKLESFHLKIRGERGVRPHFHYINSWPSTIRSLKLEPLNEDEAVKLVCGTNPSASIISKNVNFLQTLQSLSLVLDAISDKLVLSITKFIPQLLELHLEDRPRLGPIPSQDLTNVGLQSLGTCRHLKSLFLARNSSDGTASFQRVNNIGIFFLSNGCKDLESVSLSGFSKVSDAGFASILHSCPKLKKFEVGNVVMLSDRTFHGFSIAPSPLKEVKLVRFSHITNKTVRDLSSKSSLELLNLSWCRRVLDTGIKFITSLNKLICLNLTGVNITDNALSALSQCSSPIKSLSLSGCVRVTDTGIIALFHGGGRVAKTLSTLDLGGIPGITGVAIEAVAFAGNAITELCISGCHVTDSSMRALARKGQLGDGKNLPLRKLNIFACFGLSAASLGLFKKPAFRGLWWLGAASSLLDERGIGAFRDVLKERPWLTVCADGCEMGCYDGWPTIDHHMHILGHPGDFDTTHGDDW